MNAGFRLTNHRAFHQSAPLTMVKSKGCEEKGEVWSYETSEVSSSVAKPSILYEPLYVAPV